MIRYVIPVVVGACGFGAARLDWHGQAAAAEPALVRSYDRGGEASARRDDSSRFEHGRRAEFSEPRYDRPARVEVAVRRPDRRDRCEPCPRPEPDCRRR